MHKRGKKLKRNERDKGDEEFIRLGIGLQSIGAIMVSISLFNIILLIFWLFIKEIEEEGDKGDKGFQGDEEVKRVGIDCNILQWYLFILYKFF